ncbi:MAG: S1/P1 nuclease [Gammaproteobacteria bacterium]
MRVWLQLVAASVLSVICAGNAAAYGPTGHRIVGDIAESYLCRQARATVDDLLDGESLAEAGTWADRIRSDPDWRHAGPWHYINVADDVPVQRAERSDEGDVLQAIARFHAELADPAVPERYRAEALKFLVHFIADLHQPLHVGRAQDRGGNRIVVLLGGERSNLHRLWDAQALLKADRRTRSYRVKDQTRAIRALTARDVARLQATPVLDWAAESKNLRPYVYATVPRGADSFRPDADYLARAREISMLRLGQAGVRVAGTLNGLFCAGPPEGS